MYHHKFFQISVHQTFQTYQTCQMTVVTMKMTVVRHLFWLIDNYPPAPLKLQPKLEILVLVNLVKEDSG